jgi:hypothetical protein
MAKVIPLRGTFISSCNDGNIYHYNRPLTEAKNLITNEEEEIESRI